MKTYLSDSLVLSLFVLCVGRLIGAHCPSPQYLEIGSTGIIRCSFPDGFFDLYWYNTENIRHDDAVLILQDSVKSGKGFEAGEYDVDMNGSLIIHNVSQSHERTFTVVTLQTPSSLPTRSDISVLVLAKTFSYFPQINKCENGKKVCFQDWRQHIEVACFMRDARSRIPLTWMVRTINGDKNISHLSSVTNRTSFYTTVVTTDNPFIYTSLLTLLVCKADSPPGLLKRNESLLMLTNKITNSYEGTRITLYLEVGDRLTLNCSDIQTSYLVWQFKSDFDDKFQNVIYVYLMERTFVYTLTHEYYLDGKNTLTVSDVTAKHEGIYRCIASDGMQENVMIYDVFIIISPSPAYPIVDGCSHEQFCVLEVGYAGSLECSVRRIRPSVQLHLGVFHDVDSDKIQFFEQQTIIKDNGDAVDVSLRSEFRLKDTTTDRITIECKVIGEFPKRLDLSTKFDILIFTDATQPSENNPQPTEAMSSAGQLHWIIIVVLAVSFAFLAMCVTFGLGAYIRKRRLRNAKNSEEEVTRLPLDTVREAKQQLSTDQQKGHSTNSEETASMISKNNYLDKVNEFITQLKSKYEDLYDAVQPIPYIRDRLYCVERVFVEGGIEYLVSVAKIGEHGTWVALETYHNILNDPRVKSVRRIVEGEPGYGKSTLTLQLAYDWCNKIAASSLCNVDVLILLRLRQLGGVTSIYKAIKQFLLPKDSKLTEEDIKNIITESSSTVVVLDGFDEYPDQDSHDSDVISIIMKKMFQQFDVILTTRSSYLPKQYPPLTKRIKLTGFDDNAREQYIRKAVVGNDKEAAEKIKRKLKDNAVLAGLCQVPLFFVMFAHMSHESEHFQKFNSVTSFFRYMISCFHSHMKNKMKDENVQKYELFERDHKHLDKIAFEGLNAKDQKIVWKKEELCKRLGQDFYAQYVRLGILIEEDVLAINESPSSLVSSHVQYETEVRFYHKLFCEWYAAHYLAEYSAKEDVTFDQYGGPLGGRNPYLYFDEFENDSFLLPNEYLSHVELEESIDGGHFSPSSKIHLTEDSDVKTKEHILKNLDPLDLQYLYRFTCGLNSVAGEKIIQYLRGHKHGEKFAILCILEQEGKVENLLEAVQRLCSNEVGIASDDNLLLQRSTIQLLEIASSNEIPISSLELWSCFQSVDLKEECLSLSSGLQLPRLDTLKELKVNGIHDLRDSARDILDYSARCVALKTLKFRSSFPYLALLPQSFDDKDVLARLHRKNCKVRWHAPYLDLLTLNLQTGKWEKQFGQEVTDDEYLKLLDFFRRMGLI